MSAAALCVIYNPKAGRGRAARFLDGLQKRFRNRVELRPTTAPGHGEELAYDAARDGFTQVAAAGGDGTVHEVANGVLRAGRPGVVFRVLPTGSANDYAYALERERAEQGLGAVRRVDVGLVRRADGRQRYFVNGMGLGFNCAVTLEARRIRHLRGLPLYGLALLRALRDRFDCPQLTVTFDGKVRQTPTLALTVALGRREGGFLLTPRALMSDGLFDYVHAGPLRRLELLRHVPGMVTGHLPTNYPNLWTGRCQACSIESDRPLAVHLDGEFFCLPADGVRRLDVELLPGALTVSV
jgi:diacylglycerol kinase family enzyme